MPDRRTALLGSLALAGCAGSVGLPEDGPVRADRFAQANDPGWDAWVENYKGRAAGRGIPPAVISAAFAGAGYVPEAVRRDRNQAEFTRSFEDYLQLVANEERVAEGRAAFARQEAVLRRAEATYGVPAEVVCAIWGVESRYGTRYETGLLVVSATSTLAYDGRRARFFEDELTAALRIIAAGDVSPARMTGSWAGAMGHTQFIPTAFLANAVDFDGDGRRDIWQEDPTDALGSAANYLARAGWRRGVAYAAEVGTAGAGSRAITPQPGGPTFGAGPNFDVIRRYNPSDSYALAVSYLAGRIAGRGPLRAGFPPDANGLTLRDRVALQEGLNRAGFDVGTPDGVIGERTRAAVAAFEAARGLPVTGAPSRAVLGAL